MERLFAEMSEEDKKALKNTPEEDLILHHFGLGAYIRNEFGFWQGNRELLESLSGKQFGVHPDDASLVIIKALWKKLQD